MTRTSPVGRLSAGRTAADRAPAVVVDAVSRHFTPSGAAADVVALDRVSITVASGERVAVVGPSGCGKSTLLRLVAGLDTPSSGTVAVGSASPAQARAAKEIGWMAQQPALLPWRSVRDNVRLAQTINPQRGRTARDVDGLLAAVGLDGFADAYPGTLSGGMQQRAALARIMATDAPLWLMDEPFAALDELTREHLADELLGIWARERPTVVWVTHHVPEAVRLADRLVIMTGRPGSVAATVDVALAAPRDESSPAFQDVVRQARQVLRSHTPGVPAVRMTAGAT